MRIADGVEMLSVEANGPKGLAVFHPTVIWDEHEVILVDAGLPGQLVSLVEAAAKADVPFERLTKVIMTHHDMDHLGSLVEVLRSRPTKVDVLAHEGEKPYIQADLAPLKLLKLEASLLMAPEGSQPQMEALSKSYRAGYAKLSATVDKTVADGEVLLCGGRLVVVHTPGHSPGHICLYHERSKTLVAGDCLAVRDGKLEASPEANNDDQTAALQSLAKLTQYDIQTVICYHGGAYSDGVNGRIAELAAK